MEHLDRLAESQFAGPALVEEGRGTVPDGDRAAGERRRASPGWHGSRLRRPPAGDNAQRRARFTAEMIALNEAVVIDWSIPTPQSTWPFTSASTYAAA